VGDTPSEDYPGREASGIGTLRLTIVVAGVHITLATVTRDAGTGLFLTYIGEPVSANQLGRHDSSRGRAARKAEEFLLQKLRSLL
jgi:hypothetical protein